VVLAREAPVGAADLERAGVAGDAQHSWGRSAPGRGAAQPPPPGLTRPE
jgi:hypothetical protein